VVHWVRAAADCDAVSDPRHATLLELRVHLPATARCPQPHHQRCPQARWLVRWVRLDAAAVQSEQTGSPCPTTLCSNTQTRGLPLPPAGALSALPTFATWRGNALHRAAAQDPTLSE
jgi:hypothetical protein